jgi:hypothetical protein
MRREAYDISRFVEGNYGDLRGTENPQNSRGLTRRGGPLVRGSSNITGTGDSGYNVSPGEITFSR